MGEECYLQTDSAFEGTAHTHTMEVYVFYGQWECTPGMEKVIHLQLVLEVLSYRIMNVSVSLSRCVASCTNRSSS